MSLKQDRIHEHKIGYPTEQAALFALVSCLKAHRTYNSNRHEKTVYKYKGKWYLTSHA